MMKKIILFIVLFLIIFYIIVVIINVNFEGIIDRFFEVECIEYISFCNDWDFEYVLSFNFYNNNLIFINDIFLGLVVIDIFGDYMFLSDGY